MTAVNEAPAAAKKTPARKAAARKAAQPKATNGANGGNGSAAYEPPAEIRGPQEFVPEPVPTHPVYGVRKLYTYQPKDGSPLIEFPAINTVDVDTKFFWKIYAMNEMFQSFEWMNQARVPREIQERVIDLPDAEKGVFFSGWFKDITSPQGVSPPGES